MSDIISLISQYVNEIIISSGRRGGDMGSLSDLISPFSPINQFLGGGGMSSVFNLFSQMSLIPAERVGGRNTSATNLTRTQSRPKSFQKLGVAQTAVIPFFLVSLENYVIYCVVGGGWWVRRISIEKK